LKTILVVDDECPLVETLTELLELKGYRVVSAVNGLEAAKVGVSPLLFTLSINSPVTSLAVISGRTPPISGRESLVSWSGSKSRSRSAHLVQGA